MKHLRIVVTLAALLVGAYLVTPAEAQGRFWVIVNGAMRYTGPVTANSYGFTAEPALMFRRSQAATVTLDGGTLALSNGSFQASAAGFLGLTSRSQISSPADGLVNVTQFSAATVGYQVNPGTAAPTATTCGTGTVTAHSNNMAGQITATGATTCTVTFGLPNWTFTPFCSVTDVTTIAALRVSAASATAITVTGLTSSDVFNWVCGGGAF